MENKVLRDKIVGRLTGLEEKRGRLISYMTDKKDNQDWHGCCDAANDLRDIDSETLGLTWVLSLIGVQ